MLIKFLKNLYNYANYAARDVIILIYPIISLLEMKVYFIYFLNMYHSRPQSPRSFWSAPGIETSGSESRESPRITDFRLLCAASEI